MPRMVLTEKYCRSPQRVPADGRADFADALVPGLGLRVTAEGHRSFVLITRYPGSSNPTRRLLGRFIPDTGGEVKTEAAPVLLEGNLLTLNQARTKARIWLAFIQKGVDPAVEKERQRAAALRSQKDAAAKEEGLSLNAWTMRCVERCAALTASGKMAS